MKSKLWLRFDYSPTISYLVNTFIYELDIQKANISILYWKKVIDKKTYDYLYNAERMVRQVYIGKLQRDSKVANILKDGIIEAKRVLFEANNIEDYEVLSIKNDAVYIIGRLPQNLEFGLIKFIPKNTYTGFYKLTNLELYYYYNGMIQEEKLDVKGIGDSNLCKHELYFYKFLKDLFFTLQTKPLKVSIDILKQFYMQYITLSLPIEFYRPFNVTSEYKLNIATNIVHTGFILDSINDNMKPLLDISVNLNHLVNLQKILMDIYFK